METISKLWGRTIRERRRELGLSQVQVAQFSGKTQSQVARLEAGLDDPRLSSLVQVTRSLEMEMVAVPIRLLPAVQHLLTAQSSTHPPSGLVGNDPEDAEQENGDE